MTPPGRPLGESRRWLERARAVIPGASQTLSKNHTQWVQGVAPTFVRSARGAYVWDVDGNRYIDFPMALGPVLLGHADPGVNEAIARQLEDGIIFTLPHPIEVEVAEQLVDLVPGVDRVRFAKSGSEAMSAAVRLARAFTRRDTVVVCGYHGWHDWYIGSTSRSAGVPESVRRLVTSFAFNDLGSLDAALEALDTPPAAVVLEPCGADEPAEGFLEGVIAQAHAAGALVVFDEVITGFRLAPGGAQERYRVSADLVAFGKALGNGMPISALAGRAEVMEMLEDVFFSGTHGGETLALAAAREVLGRLTPDLYAWLFDAGERLRAGVGDAIRHEGLEGWVTIGGAAPRTVVTVTEPAGTGPGLQAKTLVQQELLKRGVLFNGSNFISAAHSAVDIDAAVVAYQAALALLARGLETGIAPLLDGPPIQPAFRPVA